MTDNPQPPTSDEIKKSAESQKPGERHLSERQATRADSPQQKPDVSDKGKPMLQRSERQATASDNQAKLPTDVLGKNQPQISDRLATTMDRRDQVSEKPRDDRFKLVDAFKGLDPLALNLGDPKIIEVIKTSLNDISNNHPELAGPLAKAIHDVYNRYDMTPKSKGFDYEINKDLFRQGGYSDQAIDTIDKAIHKAGLAPQGELRNDYVIRGPDGGGMVVSNVTDAEADWKQRGNDYMHDQAIRQQAIDLGWKLLGALAGIERGKQQFQSVLNSPENNPVKADVAVVGPPGEGVTKSQEPTNAAQFARLRSQLAADEISGAPAKGSALKADSGHRAASFVVDEASQGKTFTFRGDDGKQKNLTQVTGTMNGRNGIFEWIVDENGDLTHQRFIKGGEITGIPNQKQKD